MAKTNTSKAAAAAAKAPAAPKPSKADRKAKAAPKAKAAEKKANATGNSGGRDGFGALPTAGTGRMHAMLLAAKAPLPTKDFAACRGAAGGHLHCLHVAGYVERSNGGWQLTKLGRSLLGGKAPAVGYIAAHNAAVEAAAE